MEEKKINRTCSMHGKNEKCRLNFMQESLSKVEAEWHSQCRD